LTPKSLTLREKVESDWVGDMVEEARSVVGLDVAKGMTAVDFFVIFSDTLVSTSFFAYVPVYQKGFHFKLVQLKMELNIIPHLPVHCYCHAPTILFFLIHTPNFLYLFCKCAL
jgi:hypothetical protein